MLQKKLTGTILFVLLLFVTAYSQDVIVPLAPYEFGNDATFLNAQLIADTTANGGIQANRVYELQRGEFYFDRANFVVPAGRTLRLRASAGDGPKPVVYLWETGTGTTPTRPPGQMFSLNGGNLIMENICVAGFYEYEPERVGGVQGAVIQTTAAGSTIILEGVILSNINGNHIRPNFPTAKVQIKNCIFSNMEALPASNFGAGKGIDFREVAHDSVILVNNTFVNFQDRAIRHYDLGTTTNAGALKYVLIDHNSFINGMSFHGLLSLGSVGDQVIITNNVMMDAFALGEDSSDATRLAEWANTQEYYPSGKNKMVWIFTAPNDVTQWTIANNYYGISPEGQQFLNDYGFPEGEKITDHIKSKLADPANAFHKVDLVLNNTPRLMTNTMRWYETPAPDGAGKTKATTAWIGSRDDYDRRLIEYFRDTLNAAYSTGSPAYTGAYGYPAGDLNWFPDKKAQWETGTPAFDIAVDGEKDEFYNTLTGPGDGYVQMHYYAGNDNGVAYSDVDLSAKVWSAWTPDKLYMYVEVKDDTLSHSAANTYQNDGLELKIDPQATDSVANSIFAPNFTIFGGAASDSLSSVPGATWARKTVDGGYVLEMGLPWASIVSTTETITPAVDNLFGLAINIHDNDHPVGGTREHSIQWAAVMLDAVWNTPKYCGTVKLLADNKVQFIPTNNMTGRTNPLPYDGTPFWVNIDGQKDPVYNALKGVNDGYLQMRSYAGNDNGFAVNDADLSAKVWANWDNEWFYLYEEVRDDTVSGNAANSYQDDCIELKIDPQPTDSTQTGGSILGLNLTALGMATPGVTSADSLTPIANDLKVWARRKTATGYSLEMAIKWTALVTTGETITPAESNVFGMAINNHDNDGNSRQASIEWAAVMRDAVWNTPKYLGTVKFLANNKLQFIPTNSMTGATNIIPYDGSNYTPVGVDQKPQLPTEFALSQNYPNPFNPSTRINYSIIQSGNVNLRIYNMLGELVSTVVNNEVKNPGFYSVSFNASQFSSGIYVYVLRQGQNVISKKMLLLK